MNSIRTFALVPILPIMALLASCGSQPEAIPEYTIEQFYENIRISGGQFSPDESKILVTSNETGTHNLYEIDLATGTRTPVTHSTDQSLFALAYVPTTGEILYRADQDGDENFHVYRLGEDGEVVDLTPGEKVKVNFKWWSGDQKSFYFTSNRRDPKFFDVYEMDIETWTPHLLYENTDGYVIGHISGDRKMVSLEKMITTSERRLFLANLDTGEIMEISEPSNVGNYKSSGFNESGSSLFYIADAVGEFAQLHEYRIEDGARIHVYPTDWDVMYSYLTKSDAYRVLAINEDARNTVKLIEQESGDAIEMPEFEDGSILSASVSRSLSKLILTVGSSRSPENLFYYDLKTKDLVQLTNTLNPEINVEHLVKAQVIRYPSFDELEIPAIFYKPYNASPENPVPALVMIHGGPGGQSRAGYWEFVQYAANHGYALLAVNNRGSSGYGKTFFKMDDRRHGEEDLMDCIYGKKYLQSLDYVDSERIGVMGGSYGGFMTMAAMTFHPEEFKVGVNIFGVTNWIRTLKSIPAHWGAARDALYAELGDPYVDEDYDRLERISPLFHADKIVNPVMVIQGSNDVRVLQVESDEMVEAIKSNGVPVEYVLFSDEGHGFVKKKNRIEADRRIVQFLDGYLKN